MSIIRVNSNWKNDGCFSPFRDLARWIHMGIDRFDVTPYESVLDLLLLNENSVAKFVPKLGDPASRNNIFTYRIADGIVNLLIDFIKHGYSFLVEVSGDIDPWTQYCLNCLRNRGYSSHITINYHLNDVTKICYIDPIELQKRAQLSVRFGFHWDIPHVLFRSKRIRMENPDLAHLSLGDAAFCEGKLISAINHFHLASRSENTRIRSSAKLRYINVLMRKKGVSIRLLKTLIEELYQETDNISTHDDQIKLRTWLPNLEAFLCMRIGETEKALLLIEDAIVRAKGNQLPYFLGVFLKNKFNLLSETNTPNCYDYIQLFHKALSLRPFEQDWYCELGHLHLENGNIVEARESFNQAMDRGLPDADAYLGLANFHMVSGNYDESIKLLNEALQFKPKRQDLYIALSRAKEKLGHPEMSVELLLNGWDLIHDKEDIGIELLQVLLRNTINNNSYTNRILNKLSKRPTISNPKLHLLLGYYFFEEGNYKKAQEFFEDALLADQHEITFLARFYRGKVYEARGDLTNALNDWQAALILKPDHQEVQNSIKFSTERIHQTP